MTSPYDLYYQDTKTLSRAQQQVIALLPIPAAMLSVFGSSTILRMAWRTRHERRWTPYTRLLIGMSMCDIVYSLTLATSGFLYPQDTSSRIWGPIGNDSTCSLQGFFIQFSYSGILYNAMLSFYFLFAARFGFKNTTIAKCLEPVMHALSVGYPLATATVGLFMGVYSEPTLGMGCWVNNYPKNCGVGPGRTGEQCLSIMIAWIFGGAPYILVFLSIVLNNLIICCFVMRQAWPHRKRRKGGWFRNRKKKDAKVSDSFLRGTLLTGRASSSKQVQDVLKGFQSRESHLNGEEAEEYEENLRSDANSTNITDPRIFRTSELTSFEPDQTICRSLKESEHRQSDDDENDEAQNVEVLNHAALDQRQYENDELGIIDEVTVSSKHPPSEARRPQSIMFGKRQRDHINGSMTSSVLPPIIPRRFSSKSLKDTSSKSLKDQSSQSWRVFVPRRGQLETVDNESDRYSSTELGDVNAQAKLASIASVASVEDLAMKEKMKRDQLRRLQLVSSQALLFVLSYFICNIWTVLLKILESLSGDLEEELEMPVKYYWILVLNSWFLPLQGLLNMFVFIRPKYLKCRKEFPDEEKFWALRRIMFGSDVEPTKKSEQPNDDDDEAEIKTADHANLNYGDDDYDYDNENGSHDRDFSSKQRIPFSLPADTPTGNCRNEGILQPTENPTLSNTGESRWSVENNRTATTNSQSGKNQAWADSSGPSKEQSERSKYDDYELPLNDLSSSSPSSNQSGLKQENRGDIKNSSSQHGSCTKRLPRYTVSSITASEGDFESLFEEEEEEKKEIVLQSVFSKDPQSETKIEEEDYGGNGVEELTYTVGLSEKDTTLSNTENTMPKNRRLESSSKKKKNNNVERSSKGGNSNGNIGRKSSRKDALSAWKPIKKSKNSTSGSFHSWKGSGLEMISELSELSFHETVDVSIDEVDESYFASDPTLATFETDDSKLLLSPTPDDYDFSSSTDDRSAHSSPGRRTVKLPELSSKRRWSTGGSPEAHNVTPPNYGKQEIKMIEHRSSAPEKNTTATAIDMEQKLIKPERFLSPPPQTKNKNGNAPLNGLVTQMISSSISAFDLPLSSFDRMEAVAPPPSDASLDTPMRVPSRRYSPPSSPVPLEV